MQDKHIISLQAAKEAAYNSPDHIMPRGTSHDNSVNRRFNQKFYALMSDKDRTMLRVLDLGCAGGGFVKSLFDDGCLAVGLEGSDFSKRRGRAEWRTIPEYLFTCDITGEFQIYLDKGDGPKPLQFDLIACWEVMEHIAEPDIDAVVANVKRHLAENGIWICSITPVDDIYLEMNYHQTVKPKQWWIGTFRNMGLIHYESYVSYFNTQFIRGPKSSRKETFVLVLAKTTSHLPPPPREKFSFRLYDRWLSSKMQKFLAGKLHET